MNSIRNLLAWTGLAAGALLSAGAVFSLASAADTTTPPAMTSAPDGPHGWHHHHHHQNFLRQLNLSDSQKTAIKGVFQTNGPQLKSLHEQLHANDLKLRQAAPSDSNYSNVVSQIASANAPIHQQIDTLKGTMRQEIFAKLTQAQQTQLQSLEAEAEARHAAHAGATPPAT